MRGVYQENQQKWPEEIVRVWTIGKDVCRMEMFPSETPLDLQRAIMKLVRKEIDELRCFVESKRRSDSFPTADSGDEERAGDWEIDLSSNDAEDF